MNKQSNKSEALDAIEAIAERAERGEDVSGHFTNRHVAKQRVNIDFPLDAPAADRCGMCTHRRDAAGVDQDGL